jgi:integrase
MHATAAIVSLTAFDLIHSRQQRLPGHLLVADPGCRACWCTLRRHPAPARSADPPWALELPFLQQRSPAPFPWTAPPGSRYPAALAALRPLGFMRVGEATLLAWSDVEACTIAIPGQITKTGHGRTFTVPPAACRWLQQWRENCPITKRGGVFPGQAGQPLSAACAAPRWPSPSWRRSSGSKG